MIDVLSEFKILQLSIMPTFPTLLILPSELLGWCTTLLRGLIFFYSVSVQTLRLWLADHMTWFSCRIWNGKNYIYGKCIPYHKYRVLII